MTGPPVMSLGQPWVDLKVAFRKLGSLGHASRLASPEDEGGSCAFGNCVRVLRIAEQTSL